MAAGTDGFKDVICLNDLSIQLKCHRQHSFRNNRLPT